MEIKLKRLAMGVGLAVAATTQASTWVTVHTATGSFEVPHPKLAEVQPKPFHFNNQAQIDVGELGETSAVYYQVRKKNGANYETPSAWVCADVATIKANGNKLNIALQPGRYSANIKAAMYTNGCGSTMENAEQDLLSDTFVTQDFLVFSHDTVASGNGAVTALTQPDSNKYDLRFDWPVSEGADKYKLTLTKNGVSHTFTIDGAAYAQVGHHVLVDQYNEMTESFTPHTGFGQYECSVQYEINGQLSEPLAACGTTRINPLKANFLVADANNTKATLPTDVVELKWTADSRSKYFKIRERNVAGVGYTDHYVVPEVSTIIQKRSKGAELYYNHWMIKSELVEYKNDYQILACDDKDCSSGSAYVVMDNAVDHQTGATTSLKPVADAGKNERLQFAETLKQYIVNPGEHPVINEDLTVAAAKRRFGPVVSAADGRGGPDGSEDGHTPVLSEEILNRLEVKHEITPESTDLLGDKIDLATGSVSFRHTDVSLPGTSGLPVEISRSHKGGLFSFRNTLEFSDWQLDIPHIQTTLIVGSGFTGGWGRGKACTDKLVPDPVRFRYDNWEAWEYYNGTTLYVPGQTSSKLQYSSNFSPVKVVDSTTHRYVTKDNWRIRCLSGSETSSGAEGFEATSPQGVKYTFDRYRLVEGEPLSKYKYIPRFYAYMMATKVEDRFGNKVTYKYNENNRLTAIIGEDVGEETKRQIDITYVGGEVQPYRIRSVKANGRTWEYKYKADAYVTSTLDTVTRPDKTFWQFDLSDFARTKVKTYGGNCQPGHGSGEATGSITHPNGAKGSFTWDHVINGRTEVTRKKIGASLNNLIPTCFATVGLKLKELTGPGLDKMIWRYDYSQNTGAVVTEVGQKLTGTLPTGVSAVDNRAVTMTAPDGSKTKHYFNRRFDKSWDGMEVATEYFDTDGTTLLKRVFNSYETGARPGHLYLEHENYQATNNRPYKTKVVEQFYHGDTKSTYTQNFSGFNKYGQPTLVHGTNDVNNKHRYVKQTINDDTINWITSLPTKEQVSIDGKNWSTTWEKSYHSKTGDAKSKLNEEKSFGVWHKRHHWNSAGALSKIEFNTTMDNGSNRYQSFDKYKMGKALTITLPDRYDADKTQTATLLVNDHGLVTQVSNFNDEVTKYTYDAMNRVSQIDPHGDKWATTDLAFEKVSDEELGDDVVAGMFKQTIVKGGLEVTNYFDALLRPVLVKSKDTASNEVRYQRKQFNAYNKETFAAYPATNRTESHGMKYGFDGLQRPIQTTQTANNAKETTVYTKGNVKQVTSFGGDITTTTYLSYGEAKTEQMSHIDSPEGVVTTQVHNLFGNVTSITQGNVTETRVYDARQRFCKQIRPDTGRNIYVRNTIGEVTGVIKGSGNSVVDCSVTTADEAIKTVYSHDNLGTTKSINYTDSSADLAYVYDPQGNLKKLTAGTVVHVYDYYDAGVLKSEKLQVDGKTLTLAYDYNAMQAMTTLTYPDNTKVDMAPNAFGAATKAGGYATNAKYFVDGQIQSFTFGNGVTHTKALNNRKMPQSIVDSNGAMNYSYTYDNMGNVTNQTDGLNKAYSISAMTYDGLDRLTGAKGYWGTVDIDYDKLGNILHYKFDNTAQTHSTLPNSELTYQYADNRLDNVSGDINEDFIHDRRGNVIHNGRNAFTYNLAQRLTETDTTTYLYDGHGRRGQKSRQRRQLYGLQPV